MAELTPRRACKREGTGMGNGGDVCGHGDGGCGWGCGAGGWWFVAASSWWLVVGGWWWLVVVGGGDGRKRGRTSRPTPYLRKVRCRRGVACETSAGKWSMRGRPPQVAHRDGCPPDSAKSPRAMRPGTLPAVTDAYTRTVKYIYIKRQSPAHTVENRNMFKQAAHLRGGGPLGSARGLEHLADRAAPSCFY